MIVTDGYRYIVKKAGKPLRIRYYTETIGSVWDDERTLTYSGNDVYTSGALMNIDSTKGSQDAVLMEQGRIKYGDSKIYIGSEIQTTSGALIFSVAVSGLDIVYREIDAGMYMPNYAGKDIYKKIYVRMLNGGSLF